MSVKVINPLFGELSLEQFFVLFGRLPDAEEVGDGEIRGGDIEEGVLESKDSGDEQKGEEMDEDVAQEEDDVRVMLLATELEETTKKLTTNLGEVNALSRECKSFVENHQTFLRFSEGNEKCRELPFEDGLELVVKHLGRLAKRGQALNRDALLRFLHFANGTWHGAKMEYCNGNKMMAEMVDIHDEYLERLRAVGQTGRNESESLAPWKQKVLDVVDFAVWHTVYVIVLYFTALQNGRVGRAAAVAGSFFSEPLGELLNSQSLDSDGFDSDANAIRRLISVQIPTYISTNFTQPILAAVPALGGLAPLVSFAITMAIITYLERRFLIRERLADWATAIVHFVAFHSLSARRHFQNFHNGVVNVSHAFARQFSYWVCINGQCKRQLSFKPFGVRASVRRGVFQRREQCHEVCRYRKARQDEFAARRSGLGV